MEQTVGFVHAHKINYVCKLHKSIYGLKQAPWTWYDQLRQTFFSRGFTSSRMEPSLFTGCTTKDVIWVLIYVDGIVLNEITLSLLLNLYNNFILKFLSKMLEHWHFFLALKFLAITMIYT